VIVAFLDATDFEDTLRNAVSLGGDAHTLACIAVEIAHAYYGSVPDILGEAALASLPAPLGGVWREFWDRSDAPGTVTA
jgi:ADP-ribosylglycohydrolase